MTSNTLAFATAIGGLVLGGVATGQAAQGQRGAATGARTVAQGSRIVPNTGSRIGNPTVPQTTPPPPARPMPPIAHPPPQPPCLPGVPCLPGWSGGVIVYPPYPYYPWGPWPYGPYPYEAYTTYGPMTVDQLGQIDPNLAIGQPASAPAAPAPDPGLEALRAGDYDGAVAAYTQRMYAEPENQDVTRTLALATLGAGVPGRAASLMASAYQKRPELAASPLAIDGLLGGPSEARALLDRAVAQAHRTPSADLWLLVAVTMQGEGRNDVAAQMIQRAAALGLDPAVEKAMSVVLGPPPRAP